MKMSIKTKICLSALIVTAVSLIISGLIVYRYVAGMVKEQSIRDSTVKLEQVSQQFAKMQEQLKKTAEYIITDDQVCLLTRKEPGASVEEEYFHKRDLNDILGRFAVLSGFISNIIIVRSDGSIFCNNAGYEDYYAAEIKKPWFQNLEKNKVTTGFSAVHATFNQNNEEKEAKVISYLIRYQNLRDDLSPGNVLVFDIQMAVIQNILAQYTGDFESFILLNRDRNVIYSDSVAPDTLDPGMIGRALRQSGAYVEDRQNIFFKNVSADLGWAQIALISKDRLFHKTRLILVYFIIIILLSILFVFMVMIPVILNITRPLSKLTAAMKRVSQGDLDTSIAVNSGDELQILGEGFNKMVGELKEYMKVTINNEKLKRKMQNDLLISQINPHFIYNTLNSIIFLIHAGRNQEAVKITEALISILQDTVKIGDEAVFASVTEEVKIVEKYLNLQKFRYPGAFEAELAIDEDLLGINIPRMIIQPLIENALFHGICPAERPGLIKLTIKKEQRRIVVVVEDNGVGMEETKVKNLFEPSCSSKTSNQTRSIGLKNIQERLEYHFGTEYELEIFSRPGTGTKVTISLPGESAVKLLPEI